MSGDIFPLPQYAFIAWCSVKALGWVRHELDWTHRLMSVSVNTVMNLMFP
jgi:hypothetical protein